jgi:hypothetical protein
MSNTALWIVQQACSELGLPAPTTVSSSTDATNVQMLALLNSAGYDLISNFQWEEMNRTYLFDTVDLQQDYPLPDDYNYFLDSTGWDRTNRWPLLGPVSQQEWQALIAAKVVAVSRTYYKVQNKLISIWPIPASPGTQSGGRELAISYSSLNWVEDGITPGNYVSMITQDADIPVINQWLLMKFLKCKMWAAKGFDTTSLDAEFKIMFDSLTAKSKGSRVLSLAPKTGSVFIGVQNVPEGNWIR